MSPKVPRQRARRVGPALAVHTALATAVLAATVSADAPPDAALPPEVRAEEVAQLDGDTAADLAGPPAGGAVPGQRGPEPQLTGPNARLAGEVAALEEGAEDVRISAAALALDSGERVGYRGERFDTASIVKVNVVAALLLQAQDEGRRLTAAERADAAEMIRRSDNDATDEVWTAIGGARGLDRANERLGLTRTTGGGDGYWGLTQTTSEDQLALLRAIYAAGSPLDPESRAFLVALMASVAPEQRWGVSAAADGGTEGGFELKNGWLPRTESELWDINSIGRVTMGGRAYLVAVVSEGHASYEEGIAAVEAAARAAVAAVSGAPDAGPERVPERPPEPTV